LPVEGEHGDEELIARARAGDRAAFRAIAERHGPALFRYARTLTARREDAEDVLQEALLAALRSVDRFRGDASPKTWLFTILRHAAYRLNRRQAQAPRASGDLEELGRAAGWGGDDPETLASLAQDRERLRQALDSLGADDREILLARARRARAHATADLFRALHRGLRVAARGVTRFARGVSRFVCYAGYGIAKMPPQGHYGKVPAHLTGDCK